MNIVSTIMQYLTPMIVARLAGSLGLGEGLAGKAVAAAVPAILAALSGAASRGGAGAITQALGRQDPSVLGNLAGMLGGAGSKQLAQSGGDSLSSLLGGSTTGALAGAIGKFAGLGNDQSRSLLGMIAPVVLGGLAKQSQGLDAGGLTNLLAGQKDNIADAMPPGFSQILNSALTGAGTASGTDRPMSRDTGRVDASSDDDAPSTGMNMGWLTWLLPLAALALLAWWFLSPKPQMATVPAAPAVVKDMAPAAPAVPAAVPAVDLANQFGGILNGLKGQLGGVTDVDTAKAALPKLTDYASQLEKLNGLARGLSPDARGPLTAAAGGAMPALSAIIDKIGAIPGVGAILKPVLDAIVANMGALSRA